MCWIYFTYIIVTQTHTYTFNSVFIFTTNIEKSATSWRGPDKHSAITHHPPFNPLNPHIVLYIIKQRERVVHLYRCHTTATVYVWNESTWIYMIIKWFFYFFSPHHCVQHLSHSFEKIKKNNIYLYPFYLFIIIIFY